MALNLYDIHPDPENAPYYDWAFDKVPELVWERYHTQLEELKKREKAVAKSTYFSVYYACYILKGPFPAGEAAIAKNPEYAYCYARHALKGPFPAGEAAIATSAYWATQYARDILGKAMPMEFSQQVLTSTMASWL